jgi:hypothetical protein
MATPIAISHAESPEGNVGSIDTTMPVTAMSAASRKTRNVSVWCLSGIKEAIVFYPRIEVNVQASALHIIFKKSLVISCIFRFNMREFRDDIARISQGIFLY